jgi:hypothetical protein
MIRLPAVALMVKIGNCIGIPELVGSALIDQSAGQSS